MPVAYFFTRLDAAAQATPECLQAIEGVSVALNQALLQIGPQVFIVIVPHVGLAILCGKKIFCSACSSVDTMGKESVDAIYTPKANLLLIQLLYSQIQMKESISAGQDSTEMSQVKETPIGGTLNLYDDGSSFHIHGN